MRPPLVGLADDVRRTRAFSSRGALAQAGLPVAGGRTRAVKPRYHKPCQRIGRRNHGRSPRWGDPEIQRRRLLQAGLGAAALGAMPGAGQMAAHAQGTFDWKRFKGEKIEVFLLKSPRGDLLTKYNKEFEDLTGITIGWR